MYHARYYPYPSHYQREHSVLTRTIDMLLSPFRMLWEISPFLIVLKICKVIDLSWWIIVGIFALYQVVDYATDVIKDITERRYERKKEEEYRKAAMERYAAAREIREESDTWDLSDAYQDS